MLSKALLVFSLISVAFATVFVTTPTSATTYSGGQSATVNWMDDGATPSLVAFGASMISIYAGNAIEQTKLQSISNNTDVSAASTISFIVDPTIGPDSNEYFIRFESLKGMNASTPYESFSAKFTLTNMTGTFSAIVSAEIAGQSTAPLGGQTSSGTAGPTSSLSSASSTASKGPSGTSSTPSATAKAGSGAMGLKAGWAGIVFGAFVGVALF